MHISPQDIKTIKNAGELSGSEVKLIQTKGGLFIVAGKKNKTAKDAEFLAAASHPALAIHQMEKQYGNSFKPAMIKSEQDVEYKVKEHESAFGVDFKSIIAGDKIEIVAEKQGVIFAKMETEVIGDSLVLESIKFLKNVNQDVVDGFKLQFAKAVKENSTEFGFQTIKNK